MRTDRQSDRQTQPIAISSLQSQCHLNTLPSGHVTRFSTDSSEWCAVYNGYDTAYIIRCSHWRNYSRPTKRSDDNFVLEHRKKTSDDSRRHEQAQEKKLQPSTPILGPTFPPTKFLSGRVVGRQIGQCEQCLTEGDERVMFCTQLVLCVGRWYKAAVSCIQHPPPSSSSSTEWCAWLYYCSDRFYHVRVAGHQYSDRSISRGAGGDGSVGDWNHSVEQQQQQQPIVDDTYYRFNADSLRHAILTLR